jgi:sugar lactone lactonase YvrE
LLQSPLAVTRCPSGDLFVADTRNHRVRRIAYTTNQISTVLGDGSGASSGDGAPSTIFPVHEPAGLACDAAGNLYSTSTRTIRLVVADANGIVDGTGAVQTIYGTQVAASFPENVTACLTGLALVDATTLRVADACTGILVELIRQPIAE